MAQLQRRQQFIILLSVLVVFLVVAFVSGHGSHHHHHHKCKHSSPSSENHHHDHHHHHHHHDEHHNEEEHHTDHESNTQQIHSGKRHLLEVNQQQQHSEKVHSDPNHDLKAAPSKLSIWIYSLGSSFGVSLLSFVGASLLFYGINNNNNTTTVNSLQFVLSCLAVGSLLGDCFLHLLPILYTTNASDDDHDHHSHGGAGKHVHNLEASGHSFVILFGFILCLLIEVYLRIRQRREEKKELTTLKSTSHHHHHHHGGHSHIKAVGWINLIGDGIHNFMDGAGIAGAFQVSIPLGIANVLCICMHEIPQELSDYGILLSAGFTVKKALFFNFLSGVLSVVGCLFGLILTSDHGFEFLFVNEKHLVALSAGSFLYIATSMIPIILEQLVESADSSTVVVAMDTKSSSHHSSSSDSDSDEKKQQHPAGTGTGGTNIKETTAQKTSDFPTKLCYAIGGVTAGIILMHIIGIYEDSVTDVVTSFYR